MIFARPNAGINNRNNNKGVARARHLPYFSWTFLLTLPDFNVMLKWENMKPTFKINLWLVVPQWSIVRPTLVWTVLKLSVEQVRTIFRKSL